MFDHNMESEKDQRMRKADGEVYNSVTVKSRERLSMAHCVQKGRLTQGSRLHAVPVISPPSGRVSTESSQSVAACCMDLRVGIFLCQDMFIVQLLTQTSEEHNTWPTFLDRFCWEMSSCIRHLIFQE